MKILIDNSGYELKNEGDLAMLVVAANRFHQQYPNAEIQIMTVAAERLKEILPYVTPINIKTCSQWVTPWGLFGGFHKLLPGFLHAGLKKKESLLKIKYPDLSFWWIKRRLSKRGHNIEPLKAYISTIKDADMVVATGGGYITDSFERHAIIVLQGLALAQSLGKFTAMFGQGLGPLKVESILFWAKKVMPNLECLALRESVYSKPYAQIVNISEDKVAVTGDDAISLVHTERALNLGNKIGVNLRVADYSGVADRDLEQFSVIIHELSEKINTELCAIPISSHSGDSDFYSIQKILGGDLPSKTNFDTPLKVIKQVGMCRIVITGSYHAGVFALSQGVSVIAVVASDYYRYKFEGLANQFGGGCLIVDRDMPEFYDKFKIAVIEAWDNAEVIRPKLLDKAQEQIELSEAAYQKFYNVCNKE